MVGTNRGMVLRNFMKFGVPFYVVSVAGSYYYFVQRKKHTAATTQTHADPTEYSNRKAVFDSIAHEYDKKINMDEIVMGMKLFRWALIRRHAVGKVLEVSTGTGRNLKYYRWSPQDDKTKNGVTSLTLSDASESMLETLQQQAELECSEAKEGTQHWCQDKHGHCINLSCCSVESLPYPDNSFDTVVDTFGLCSAKDPHQALKEMVRVCKPSGKILLLEHGRSRYKFLSNILDKNASEHASKWGCWWNRDIRQMVKEVGGLAFETFFSWHFDSTFYIVATKKPVESEATATCNER